MYIPKYFTLNELLRSDEAKKHGVDNTPPTFEIIKNLSHLGSLLDIFRENLGEPIRVTSGFRTPECNNLLRSLGYNAVHNSWHIYGHAADIKPFDPRQLGRLQCIVMEFVGIPIKEGIKTYETDKYEVIFYSNRIHFAFKYRVS